MWYTRRIIPNPSMHLKHLHSFLLHLTSTIHLQHQTKLPHHPYLQHLRHHTTVAGKLRHRMHYPHRPFTCHRRNPKNLF
ncbi:hypothetical protein HanIR_Chr13g0634531 [Helianthus annuus]|nr:hypothetical protein HanIR_Chr13g0634531 [Helianthus annuus]